MFKRILVPVDGSAYSTEVIPIVAEFAVSRHTDLQLVRIVRSASDQRAEAPDLERVAAGMSAGSRCIVDESDTASAILREAARVPHTLIAMTSHGRTGLLEALLGSVALRIVRARGAPVLVYRPRGQAERSLHADHVSRVVLPLDGSKVAQAMVPQAAHLAVWLGVRLVVVSVINIGSDIASGLHFGAEHEATSVRARAQELARQYGVVPSWEVLHGKPAQAISDFARNERGTVLAMCTHGRSALRSALLGSVTAGCLRKSGVPILMQAP